MDYLAVIAWIIATLKANSALTALVNGSIYRGMIPQGVPLPSVRIDLITAVDRRFTTGARALTNATIQIAACTQGDDAQQPAAIFQALDAAIDQQICRSGLLTAKIMRGGIVDSSEAVEGERFNMLGARYTVIFYQPNAAGAIQANVQVPGLAAPGPITITVSGPLARPSSQSADILVDTSGGPLALACFDAIGSGGDYTIWNIGSNDFALSGVASTILTVASGDFIRIRDFVASNWSYSMSFKNQQLPTGKDTVETTITTTQTLTKDTAASSVEGVDTTGGSVVITLYTSTGDGTKRSFVKTAGPVANTVSFLLSSSDSTPATLSNTILSNIGDEQGWEEIAANKWGAF